MPLFSSAMLKLPEYIEQNKTGWTLSEVKDFEVFIGHHLIFFLFQDLLLLALLSFYKKPKEWSIIKRHFPSRTELDCQWRKIKVRRDAALGKVPKTEFRLQDFEIIHPHKLEQLPLLPLLNVCKYLNPEDIFKTLPITCRQLNHLVLGNQFPLKRLHINGIVGVMELVTLSHKISSCEVLDLEWSARDRDAFWQFAIGLLLTKFKSSLKALVCTAECGVQIWKFLAIAESLKGLYYCVPTGAKKWDWEAQNCCLSLELLILVGYKFSSTEMLLILTKFPNLTSISFWSVNNPLVDDKDFWNSKVVTRLKRFEGRIMLNYYQLSWVEEICLYPQSSQMIEKFLLVFPKLRFLRQVRIIINQVILTDMIDPDITAENHLKFESLLEVLGQSTVLVDLTVDVYFYPMKFLYEMVVTKGLLQLPASLQTIRFNGRTLRSPDGPSVHTCQDWRGKLNGRSLTDLASEVRALARD